MALYKRKDFIKLCGIQSKHLTTFIKRGQVIIENDLIDGDNPTNAFFIEKKRHQHMPKDLEEKTGKEVLPVPKTKRKAIESTDLDESNLSGESAYALDIKKKTLDIEKITVETRLLVLREEKQRGEVIPIDIVKTLIIQLSQNFVTESKNISDNMLSVVAKKAGLNVNEIAVLRGEMAKSINVAIDKAVEASKISLSGILSEYSVKKEVGEHQ